MSPPGVDPLNEQLGMEAVLQVREVHNQRSIKNVLCKFQVNNKYAHVQAQVTVHATEAAK
jgi:hypothetical protein